MAFNVRIFGFAGIRQSGLVLPRSYSSNGDWALMHPYNWVQILVTNGTTPVGTTVVPSDTSQFIRIEVDDGNTVRYELNPPYRSVSAAMFSPRNFSARVLPWGAGWTINIADASAFPDSPTILTDDTGSIRLIADDGSAVLAAQ